MKNLAISLTTVACGLSAFAEIEVESGPSSDGQFFQIEFDAEPGWLYSVEEADATGGSINWIAPGFGWYYGGGQRVLHNAVELPQNDGSPLQVDPNAPVPENTTFHIRDIEGGAGSLLRWRSKAAGEEEPAEYILWGTQLPEFFSPIFDYSAGSDRFYLFQAPEIPLVELPNPLPLGPEDSQVLTKLVAEWQNIIDAEAAGTQSSAPNPGYNPDNRSGLYRVARYPMDTDSDGFFDHEEFDEGTDPYDWDTDGDGIPDGTDPEPLVNEALSDPDGANLPASLDQNLVGRWDFEDSELTILRIYSAAQVDNEIDPAFPAYVRGGLFMDQDGMVSKCAPAETFTVIDGNILQPGGGSQPDEFTVSFWMRFEEGFISGLPENGIFRTVWALEDSNQLAVTAYGNCLSVRRPLGGGEEWYIGPYTWAQNGGSPSSTVAGTRFTFPEGTHDVGEWHHIVVRWGDDTYTVYVDGQVATTAVPAWYSLNFAGLDLNPNPSAETKMLFCRFFELDDDNQLNAKIDRARVYDVDLSEAEVQALFKQDIDRDGLWDITENRSLLWQDENSDEQRTANETEYVMNPYYWDPPYADHDQDDLTSLYEQNVTLTLPTNPDTDGDLLSDGWEFQSSLNPLDDSSPNGKLDDPDGDNLSNMEESIYGTDPNYADSDSDTVNDDVEIAQGGDPNDSSDEGLPPDPSEIVELRLWVGDPSDSESERYILIARDLDSGRVVVRHQAEDFGVVSPAVYNQFRIGRSYSFQIHHAQTKPSHLEAGKAPDFDYFADVEFISALQEQRYIGVDPYDPDVHIAQNPVGGRVVLENSRGPGGIPVGTGDSEVVEFKTTIARYHAAFFTADLDVKHPATGELEESNEDSGFGGLVAAKRSPESPITSLVINDNTALGRIDPDSGNLTPRVQLRFTSGDRYKIWNTENPEHGVEVASEETTWAAKGEVPVFLEGVEESGVPGQESVELLLEVGGVTKVVDSVSFSVIKAEYDVFFTAFIPYQWVQIPHPHHLLDVAKGDDRGPNPLETDYRVGQFAVVVPFPELSQSGFREVNGLPVSKINLANVTVHFDRFSSLPNPLTGAIHEGNDPGNRLLAAALSEEEIEDNWGSPWKTVWGVADTSDMHIEFGGYGTATGNGTATYTFDGAASEPVIWLAAAIDWNATLEFEVVDPFNVSCSLTGEQDGFPAYECYIYSSIGDYDPADLTTVYQWVPPLGRGVLSLAPVVDNEEISVLGVPVK